MKQVIRKDMLARLKMQNSNQVISCALNLINYLKPIIDQADNIAIYHANDYEMTLKFVIDYCIEHKKGLYQPVAYKREKSMLLVNYNISNNKIFSEDDFVPGITYEWYNLDLVLLPLIAVDKNGVRLGKGGGYYDATLAQIVNKKTRPFLCGVGFDFQLIPMINSDHWDIRLDYFASEKQLIQF